jgi:hypothetical protein
VVAAAKVPFVEIEIHGVVYQLPADDLRRRR